MRSYHLGRMEATAGATRRGQIASLHRQRWPQPGTRHQYGHEQGGHDDQALDMDSSGNPG
jgi:hypothetical protein